MCIIAIKPSGATIDWQRMERCFANNPAGAGYAFHCDNTKDPKLDIFIVKGFMDFDGFKRDVIKRGADAEDVEAMFHFRIATHGAHTPANTHPFPLSTDDGELQALSIATKVAVAHNGVFQGVGTDAILSDTQLFVRDVLAPLGESITWQRTKPLVAHAVNGSRVAIMNRNGITRYGGFVGLDDWWYSNTSHARSKAVVTYHKQSTPAWPTCAFCPISIFAKDQKVACYTCMQKLNELDAEVIAHLLVVADKDKKDAREILDNLTATKKGTVKRGGRQLSHRMLNAGDKNGKHYTHLATCVCTECKDWGLAESDAAAAEALIMGGS